MTQSKHPKIKPKVQPNNNNTKREARTLRNPEKFRLTLSPIQPQTQIF
jgi:hypothetical protein